MIVFAVVIVAALGLVQYYGDDGDGPPDLQVNDRVVTIKFHGLGGSKDKPVRFDVDGGFSGGVDFSDDDKPDGYQRTGHAVAGTVAWARMWVHVYSVNPTSMWCEVWLGGKDITYRKDTYPAAPAYCAGQVV
jgi:hypothetical protein